MEVPFLLTIYEKRFEPLGPYAEQVVEGYLELASPIHNSINQVKFVDRPERSDEGIV